jgi:sugar phosphate isomerase/epimerase
MNKPGIALQLYTLRALTGQDMQGTLREVSKQGYHAVEFAGLHGMPAEELRSELDSLGMQAVATHISLDDLEMRPAQTLATAKMLGCAYVVLSSIPEERRTAPQVQQIALTLNSYGDTCRAQGVRFAYHNHDFEFAPLDAGGNAATMFDLLVKGTDRHLVGFELDVYWVRYTEKDPASMTRQLAGRVPLLHAKDMAAGETRADVPVGEGVLRWDDILRAGAEAGVEWYIVELDNPRNPLADAQTALRNLSAFLPITNHEP